MKTDKNDGTIPMQIFASAKTANIGTTIRQVPSPTIIFGVENKIQNTGLKWFSSEAMLRITEVEMVDFWMSWNPHDQ